MMVCVVAMLFVHCSVGQFPDIECAIVIQRHSVVYGNY